MAWWAGGPPGIRVAFDPRKVRAVVALMGAAGPGTGAVCVRCTRDRWVVGFAMGQTLVPGEIITDAARQTTGLRAARRAEYVLGTSPAIAPSAIQAGDYRQVIEA